MAAMSSGTLFHSEDGHTIIGDDEFAVQDQLDVVQLDKYLSNDEQSPESYLSERFENDQIQTMNMNGTVEFGDFVSGTNVFLNGTVNKSGLMPAINEQQLMCTTATFREQNISPAHGQNTSSNFNYTAVGAPHEHQFLVQNQQYLPNLNCVGGSLNKKRKMDPEPSIAPAVPMKNPIAQFSLPHGQNNYNNEGCPNYGDTVSPTSSNMTQCTIFNDNGEAIDVMSSGASKAASNHLCIGWELYEKETIPLYDFERNEIAPVAFRVEADKGFNFSYPDAAFVCQKKNHFQVTISVSFESKPTYAKFEKGGLIAIQKLYVDLYGIKTESPDSVVKIEQSQSDRSKKPFEPIEIDFNAQLLRKMTLGRLHFSETTANNMRKKGKPNPDQRYFSLVVSLYAILADQSKRLIIAQRSEKIIIRASNPGQFESDGDSMWAKGASSDTVIHMGRVGINTQTPDEALVVHGNIQVTGHISQPSDERVKRDIRETDTQEQLRNVSKMKIVNFKYKRNFAVPAGLDPNLVHTGVLAQEVKTVIPDAVVETSDVTLTDGENVPELMVVNKDRIYMENVGAVKELCKLTGNLENRIHELEAVNNKHSKRNRSQSTSSTTTRSSRSSMRSRKSVPARRSGFFFSHKYLYMIIASFVLIMLLCVAAIVTLYVLHLQREKDDPVNMITPLPFVPTASSNNTINPLIEKNSTFSTPDGSGVSDPTPVWPPQFAKGLYTIKCCSSGTERTDYSTRPKGTPKPEHHQMDSVSDMQEGQNGDGGYINLLDVHASPQSQIYEGNLLVIKDVSCMSCGPGNYTYYLPLNSTTSLVPITIALSFAQKMQLMFCDIAESLKNCCGTNITPPRYSADEGRYFNEQFRHVVKVPAPFFMESSYKIRAYPASKNDITCESRSGIENPDFIDFIYIFKRFACQ